MMSESEPNATLPEAQNDKARSSLLEPQESPHRKTESPDEKERLLPNKPASPILYSSSQGSPQLQQDPTQINLQKLSTSQSTQALPWPATRALSPPAPCLDPVSDTQFNEIIDAVRLAIAEDAQPMRIGQGSSGSYFCRNSEGQILGVFKPKDEEPYGDFNPKWTKWIHRNVFFCCFGRSCLIPNVGYLSEAGASLLDRRLGFGIVPITNVVSLVSPAFYYSKKYRNQTRGLPHKTGSFQLFLRGFKDAHIFLKIHPLPEEPPQGSIIKEEMNKAAMKRSSARSSPSRLQGEQPQAQQQEDARNSSRQTPSSSDNRKSEQKQVRIDIDPSDALPSSPGYTGIWDSATYDSFLNQFQRLTILDYLMRNTDRGLDNWMFKYSDGRIQVAAIDHGLAFPFKHPDKWRSYPYGWLGLPIAKLPFIESLRHYIITLFRNPLWWARTRTELRELFAEDKAGFNYDRFESQMAVIRGQMYNLLKCLEGNGSPWDLWFRTPIIVVQQPVPPSEWMQRPNGRSASSKSDRQVPSQTHSPDEAARKNNLAATNPLFTMTDHYQDDFEVAGEWIENYDDSEALLNENGSGSSSEHHEWHRHRAQEVASSSRVSPASSDNVFLRGSGRPEQYRNKMRGPPSLHYCRHSSYEDDPHVRDRVLTIWDKGKQKVRAGGQSIIRRVRSVILQTKKKPWFTSW